MTKTSRAFTGLSVALALVLGSTVASAQSRSQIVAKPASFETRSAVSVRTPVASAAPTAGVIIITPQPLPPRPPNFCFRGNSAGVSRC